MKGSEGRKESRLYQATLYVVLILGALPILLPFYWMLIASVKTKDRVEATPPDWLPVVPKHFIRVNDQELRVKVFDDGRTSGTNVSRVKVLHDEGMPRLKIPRGRIKRDMTPLSYATIDGRRKRVTPILEGYYGDTAEVAIIGTQRQLLLNADEIERETVTKTYWNVLGADVEVVVAITPTNGPMPATMLSTSAAPLPVDGYVEVLWIKDAPPMEVSSDLIVPGTPFKISVRPRVETVNGHPVRTPLLVPVSQVERNEEAGFWTVRLQYVKGGVTTGSESDEEAARKLCVPAAEMRRASRTRYFAMIDGERREVKHLGVDQVSKKTRIEVIGEPICVHVPRSAIEHETSVRYFARVLDQEVEILPTVVPLSEGPAMTTVRILGELSVVDDSEDVYDSDDAEQVTPGSVMRTETRLEPQWSNFAQAWKHQRFDVFLANTLIIAALSVLGTVLSCGLVGYAFARMRFRGSNALFLVLLSTMMIPGQVTSIPTFVLFSNLGWIDTFLPLVVPSFLAHSAFFVFLFRQFMMTIPADLEDAARIDGCGPLATWWLVMMPLSKPIIVTVAVFSFIGAWNDFLGPLLYINSEHKQTIALGLQTFKSAYQNNDPQLLMAASVMMLIPTVILFFVAQKAFIRGVVVSGVKG